MDASVAGIRLASGVLTPLIKKLLRGEGAGAGLVDHPVRISSYVSLREKRVLDGPDLRKLADRLVEEALRAPASAHSRRARRRAWRPPWPPPCTPWGT
nr:MULTISPECIES: hypothetical protein [unclassified Streptomyces]